MQEKKWRAVAPRAFTANGTSGGVITIDSTKGFYVKQHVRLTSSAFPNVLILQVKDVISKTQLIVGPLTTGIDDFSDVSGYLVADSASISALRQPRPAIPLQEHERAVYEEEPAVAKRVILVDELGDKFSVENPLPVQLSDGSINIETLNAQLEVHLSAQGADFDSVRIGDGTDTLNINPDGSINVVSSDVAAQTPNVSNLLVVTANTEESFSFPAGTKRFALKPRTPAKMQIAYASGQTGTNYISVNSGKYYEEKNVNIVGGLTVYFELNKPNTTVEILYWT